MSREERPLRIPPVGRHVTCLPILAGVEEGLAIYRPSPLAYYVNGRRVDKAEFDAAGAAPEA